MNATPETITIPTWADLTFTQRAGVVAYWAARFPNASTRARASWWNRRSETSTKAGLLAAFVAVVETQTQLDQEDEFAEIMTAPFHCMNCGSTFVTREAMEDHSCVRQAADDEIIADRSHGVVGEGATFPKRSAVGTYRDAFRETNVMPVDEGFEASLRPPVVPSDFFGPGARRVEALMAAEDTCRRGTPGCSVIHSGNTACETW
jgi:hypothetical protein